MIKLRSCAFPFSLLLAAFAASSGCTLGDNYSRPKIAVPQTFRDAKPAAEQARSFAQQIWSETFTDPALAQLIQSALRDNLDLAIAAMRVIEAEAQYGVVHSQSFPTLEANAGAGAARSRLGGRGEPVTGSLFQLGATVSWEVDFWGRYRRANEAARAVILATEWGRRAVVTTLVGQIAAQYFQLRAFDRSLDIARRTLTSRQDSLKLAQIRETGGAGTLIDVSQAELLVEGAQASIVDLERSITQQENRIAVLVGAHPGPITRGQDLTAEPRAVEVPTGLPSQLLERRPDIQAAEQRLVAANAQVGIAHAAYFPNIRLTGSGGVASYALSSLFSAPAIVWSAAASALQPIFEGGRLDAQLKLSEAQRQEAVLSYRATILQAFREVSDALVGYEKGHELRGIQAQLVESAQRSRRLADLRYQGGVASYLEVLDSDSRLFSAELTLVQAELSELSAFVEIYRALGGGWQVANAG